MLVKFPKIPNNNSDNSFIAFGRTPYAKHNIITKTTGKTIGFLAEHSLMFIVKGKKYFHFEEGTVCIDTNELILVKRGIYTISEFIPEHGCFEALIIFIPDKFLQTFYKQINITDKDTEKTYSVQKCDKLLIQFQSQYLNYFSETFQVKEQLLTLKLQELFLLLQNNDLKGDLKEFVSTCISKESIDIEYIVKSNLFQPLSVEDYAKLCLRSLASFKRDFKKQFNSSPRHWINQQRILHSVQLLKTTHKTINEIAFDCGFQSTSHFIKLFKTQFGYTPTSTRANIDTV